MRNFIFGVIVGICGTYWYLTGGSALRGMVDDLWTRASAPPPAERRVP